MSRSRAATPAAKRRAGARAGTATTARGSTAKPRRSPSKPKQRAKPKPKPKSKAGAKPKPSARARPRTKPKPKPRRLTAARRSPAKRKRTAPRSWSRPRPLRALRGAVTGVSWRYRLGILVVVLATAAAGYLFWLRDSSLVAVTNVDVVGVASGDRETIVAELTAVAKRQTTLHADAEQIERVASSFPTVASVDVDPNFPHGMRLEVTERPPAVIVEAGSEQVPAAADGSLLTGVTVPEGDALPVVEAKQMPADGMLEGDPLQQALVLGAAPAPLQPLVEKVGHSSDHGVEVTMRGGIPIRFGSGSGAAEKWASAAAMLADPDLDAVAYLDVRVPERPVAGGAAEPEPLAADPAL